MADPTDEFVTALVGLPLEEASREAADAGWSIRTLAPRALMSMDYRESRVNLEHDAGVVTRAWVG